MPRPDWRTADEETPAFDPLADVLFGAVALVFVALLIVAPRLTSATPPASDRLADRSSLTFEGRDTAVVVAEADGVRLSAPQSMSITLNAIAGNPKLVQALEAARRDSNGRIILLIEPQGAEAAFALDPVLAHAGFDTVEQVRLLQPCRSGGQPVFPRNCLR